MIPTTSDSVAQRQLMEALRAAQKKIVAEGKRAQSCIEEQRRRAIAERAKLLWGAK